MTIGDIGQYDRHGPYGSIWMLWPFVNPNTRLNLHFSFLLYYRCLLQQTPLSTHCYKNYCTVNQNYYVF